MSIVIRIKKIFKGYKIYRKRKHSPFTSYTSNIRLLEHLFLTEETVVKREKERLQKEVDKLKQMLKEFENK